MSEIKDIPEHWEVKKLGEVADYINGRAFKPTEWERTGKPIIRIQNLNKDAAAYNYSKNVFEDKYKVEKGDLLYAWSASLGVYIWNGESAWLNQHIFKVVPKNISDKKYLFYILGKITAELYAKAHGSGMVHVTKGKFEATEIPFPPLPEQQAIVAKIEELLSELDNGKEQLQTALQQLKVYRQSLLKWHYDKSVGSVPVKLVDVCEFITKGTTPSKDKLLNYKGDVPFLKVYNLTFNGTIDFSKDPTFVDNETHNVFLKRSRVYPNDVLMNIVGLH